MRQHNYRVMIAAFMGGVACGSQSPTIAPAERVASVTLVFAEGSPKAQGLLPGAPPTRLRFEARDGQGQLVTEVIPTFVSSDSSIVTVTPDGLVSARRAVPSATIVRAYVRSSTRMMGDSVYVTITTPL
jgi:hypothetical protein